jgi:hypothetical protein
VSEFIIRTQPDAPRVFAQKRRSHFHIHGTNERFYGTPVEIEAVDFLIEQSGAPTDE